MRPKQTNLGSILRFYNGAEASFFDNGEYIVYGSNGPIGKSINFNIENAIIMGRVGAYCGSIKIAKNKFWASDNTIVVKPKYDYNLEYLYYLLISFPLRNYAGGAAQPLLTHTILRAINIKCFTDYRYQRKIASILSVYDDLIDTNRRRIQLLEEAARLLFREWFVYFRFPSYAKASEGTPGHEKVKVIDGVPDGWEKKKIIKVLNLEYGKSLVADKREEGSIPVYGSSGVIGFHNRALVGGPGIVVGRAGNAGSVHWVNEDFFPVDSTFYVKTKMNDYLFYFYYYLSICHLERFISGSAVPGLNRNIVHSSTILLPNKDIVEKFNNLAQQITKQCSYLRNQNQKLAQARDLLLPRLMSGKIDPIRYDKLSNGVKV